MLGKFLFLFGKYLHLYLCVWVCASCELTLGEVRRDYWIPPKLKLKSSELSLWCWEPKSVPCESSEGSSPLRL